jgi:hypothetical protein
VTTYRFSRHAKNQLRWRRLALDPDLAIDIIEKPDRTTPTEKNRTNAWRQRNGGWHRVTYIVEGDTITIISINEDDIGPPQAEGSSGC